MVGAASPLTVGLLHGPERRATVLGCFPTAVYLRVGAHHEVLPLLTGDALLLPTGLRLPVASADLRWDVAAGDEVVVGHSEVRLAGWSIRVVRQWRPSRVNPVVRRASGQALLATAAAVVPVGPGRELADRAGTLLQAALRGDGAGVTASVRSLVGAGRGLTPSGDDAICAVLLVLHGIASLAGLRTVAAAVTARHHSTTSLSASLLDAAAHGYAVPQVSALVTAALAGDDAAAVTARDDVLAIGHSSGRDLAAGLTGCLRALALLPHAVPPPVAPQPVGRDKP